MGVTDVNLTEHPDFIASAVEAATVAPSQTAGALRNLTLYNPPTGGPFKERPELAARVIDTVCYTMGDERLQYVLDMRKAGWQGDLWMYMLQHGIRDVDRQAEKNPGTPAMTDKGAPWRNNFAYKGSKDIVRLRDTEGGHPFLLSPDGKIIRKNSDRAYVVADTSHKAWRTFVRERLQELSSTVGSHYAGLWLDDLNSDSLYLFEVGKTETRQYGDPEGEKYFEVLISYLEFMRSQSAAVGWRFGGNLQGQFNDRWMKAARELIKTEIPGQPGVVMVEFAWLKWDGSWPSEKEWKQTFDKASFVTANGGEIWLVVPVNGEEAAKGGTDNVAYQKARFGYISSLLLADGHTAVRIGKDYAFQGNFEFFGEGDQLGKPDETIRIEGSTYRRSFEHGEVWVNLKDHTCGIEYTPVVDVPEVPETPEPPVEEPPAEQPPVEEPPVEEPAPETPTPEPDTFKASIYIGGRVGDVPVQLMIGFDSKALLPILAQIAATLKESVAEVAPQ